MNITKYFNSSSEFVGLLELCFPEFPIGKDLRKILINLFPMIERNCLFYLCDGELAGFVVYNSFHIKKYEKNINFEKLLTAPKKIRKALRLSPIHPLSIIFDEFQIFRNGCFSYNRILALGVKPEFRGNRISIHLLNAILENDDKFVVITYSLESFDFVYSKCGFELVTQWYNKYSMKNVYLLVRGRKNRLLNTSI